MKTKKGNAALIFIALFAVFSLSVMTGCSIFSKNPGNPVHTVTVTVTETEIKTVTPSSEQPKETLSPSPSVSEEAGEIDEIITPPNQIYQKDGKVTDIEKIPEEKAIRELLKKGYITAYKDGKFRPKEPVKRGIYLLWLYNASGADTPLAEPEKPTFPDLTKGHWLYKVLEGIVQSGGFKDYPAKDFKPDAPLTREEWCVISAYFAADPQHIIESVDTFPDSYKLCKYTDFKAVKKVNHRFVEYACSVLWTEKTFGKSIGKIKFNPQKPVTRAQAAKWIYMHQKNLKIY